MLFTEILEDCPENLLWMRWVFGDCNWTQTHNHLVSLAKWLSVRLWTKWLWVQVQLQSLKLQILHLFKARSSLTFRKIWSVDSLQNAYMTWQVHTVSECFVFVVFPCCRFSCLQKIFDWLKLISWHIISKLRESEYLKMYPSPLETRLGRKAVLFLCITEKMHGLIS